MTIGIGAIAYCTGSMVVDNSDLQAENPSWDMARIVERTGIQSRPVASNSESSLSLGEQAARKLLTDYDFGKIEALIFCTQTPSHILPPNSTLLHGRLGLPERVMAFDISHACSGFVYGLGIAQSLVAGQLAKNVLLINADTYTRLLHPQDRATRPIFGDGAAATLISGENPLLSIIDTAFYTAGSQANRFIIRSEWQPLGATTPPAEVEIDSSGRVRSDRHVYMDGLGVLSFFTSAVTKAVNEILVKNKLTIYDVSCFVFHQASKMALDGLRKSLRIPDDKLVMDIEQTGNLVSASIPVALARVVDKNVLRSGQLVVLCGFGVGLSWATALVRYNGRSQ
jgi:3-oxoacyl-[acyl-carrier-protein] synthase-3